MIENDIESRIRAEHAETLADVIGAIDGTNKELRMIGDNLKSIERHVVTIEKDLQYLHGLGTAATLFKFAIIVVVIWLLIRLVS